MWGRGRGSKGTYGARVGVRVGGRGGHRWIVGERMEGGGNGTNGKE